MKSSNSLDYRQKRREKRKNFLIVAGILLVIATYVIFQVTCYINQHPENNVILVVSHLFDAIKEHPVWFPNLFGEKTGTMFALYFGAFFLIAGYFYTDMERRMKDSRDVIAGSAMWNNDFCGFKKKFGEPDTAKGVRSRNTLILSENVALSVNTRKTRKNLNVLVIGGAGEGKSRFYVKPNMLQANCDMVITDPSGELIEDEGNFLAKEGYTIKVLNLVDMTKSNKYNPFHYIRDENGVLMMINCLIENTTSQDERGGEKFWKDTERQMLQALAFYLLRHQPREKQNFSSVLELLRLGDISEKDDGFFGPLDKLFLVDPSKDWDRIRQQMTPAEFEEEQSKYFKYCEPWASDAGEYDRNGNFVRYIDSAKRILPIQATKKANSDPCLMFYRDYKKAAGRTAKGIIISCSSRLNPFNLYRVRQLTDSDEMRLEEFGGLSDDPDRQKQALFAIIPAQEKTYNFIVAMMYSQLFETLYYHAITNPKCKNVQLPRHVRFLLDEFPNVGKIPDFNEKLATMRKHEISCSIIIQSLSQLKAMYKEQWETMIDNCSSLLFLGGQAQDTTEYISKMLGQQTVLSAGMSHSITGKGQASEDIKATQRALMYADELRQKPHEKMIILIGGVAPFYDDKYDYQKHPNYMYTADYGYAVEKGDIHPVPGHQESLGKYVLTANILDEDQDDIEERGLDEEQRSVTRSQKLSFLTFLSKEDVMALDAHYSKWPDIGDNFMAVTSKAAAKLVSGAATPEQLDKSEVGENADEEDVKNSVEDAESESAEETSPAAKPAETKKPAEPTGGNWEAAAKAKREQSREAPREQPRDQQRENTADFQMKDSPEAFIAGLISHAGKPAGSQPREPSANTPANAPASAAANTQDANAAAKPSANNSGAGGFKALFTGGPVESEDDDDEE